MSDSQTFRDSHGHVRELLDTKGALCQESIDHFLFKSIPET